MKTFIYFAFFLHWIGLTISCILERNLDINFSNWLLSYQKLAKLYYKEFCKSRKFPIEPKQVWVEAFVRTETNYGTW